MSVSSTENPLSFDSSFQAAQKRFNIGLTPAYATANLDYLLEHQMEPTKLGYWARRRIAHRSIDFERARISGDTEATTAAGDRLLGMEKVVFDGLNTRLKRETIDYALRSAENRLQPIDQIHIAKRAANEVRNPVNLLIPSRKRNVVELLINAGYPESTASKITSKLIASGVITAGSALVNDGISVFIVKELIERFPTSEIINQPEQLIPMAALSVISYGLFWRSIPRLATAHQRMISKHGWSSDIFATTAHHIIKPFSSVVNEAGEVVIDEEKLKKSIRNTLLGVQAFKEGPYLLSGIVSLVGFTSVNLFGAAWKEIEAKMLNVIAGKTKTEYNEFSTEQKPSSIQRARQSLITACRSITTRNKIDINEE